MNRGPGGLLMVSCNPADELADGSADGLAEGPADGRWTVFPASAFLPLVLALLVAAPVEGGHRLVGRARLQLHEVGARVVAFSVPGGWDVGQSVVMRFRIDGMYRLVSGPVSGQVHQWRTGVRPSCRVLTLGALLVGRVDVLPHGGVGQHLVHLLQVRIVLGADLALHVEHERTGRTGEAEADRALLQAQPVAAVLAEVEHLLGGRLASAWGRTWSGPGLEPWLEPGLNLVWTWFEPGLDLV